MADPDRPARATAVAIPAVLVAIVSFQTGAAIAKTLFPALGPLGMAALRSGVAALAMCAVLRPSPSRLTRATVARLVPYGVSLAGMNACFYLALVRLPLGPAVAIEFLGPLAVALAASRRAQDVLVVAFVVFGLVLLLGPSAARTVPDPRGVAWALLAALFWAGYILAGRRVGAVLPAASAAAFGMVVAALTILPFSLASFAALGPAPSLLWPACLVALLSSALPYTLEMVALKRLPTRVFGVLMSLEPAVGAVAGAALLGEHLAARRWAGVFCVVAASLASALASGASSGEALRPDVVS